MNAAKPAPGTYRGRFAPSPTGALHAGSLVAALASWLDARAHEGSWLVRIEDLDPPREAAGAAADIIDTLAAFGMASDEPVLFQSDRAAAYEAALQRLQQMGLVYGCACSRKDIDAMEAQSGVLQGVYPGTCRTGTRGRPARAIRVRVPAETFGFDDRARGAFAQQLERDVGDFVVRRADGLWAYQLAVVVDDAAQGITDVVRGADLIDNTPRQIFLQCALGYATPQYMHVPIMTNQAGEKLSKQTGAQPVDRFNGLSELERAWQHLGFARLGADSREAFLARAVELWRERWAAPSTIAPPSTR